MADPSAKGSGLAANDTDTSPQPALATQTQTPTDSQKPQSPLTPSAASSPAASPSAAADGSTPLQPPRPMVHAPDYRAMPAVAPGVVVAGGLTRSGTAFIINPSNPTADSFLHPSPSPSADSAHSEKSAADTPPAEQPQVRDPATVLGLKRELIITAAAVLKSHTGYDMIPDSGKVVVFDSRIPVKDAFFGLQEHSMKGAPVWDSHTRAYAGMITITDFIDILRYFHSDGSEITSSSVAKAMDTQKIHDWAAIKAKQGTSINRLLYIPPEGTLYQAAQVMSRHRIHRICVVQEDRENTVLCVLDLHRLIRFLLTKLGEASSAVLGLTVAELNVGTFHDIITVTYDTPLVEALNLLSTHRISGLPIIDKDGRAVDIYSRSDVRYLAVDNTFDLTAMTLHTALHAHTNDRPVPICSLNDTLATVLVRLVTTNKHRLIVVDSSRRIQGLISLSDIISFLVEPRHNAYVCTELEAMARAAGAPLSGPLEPQPVPSDPSVELPLPPMARSVSAPSAYGLGPSHPISLDSQYATMPFPDMNRRQASPAPVSPRTPSPHQPSADPSRAPQPAAASSTRYRASSRSVVTNTRSSSPQPTDAHDYSSSLSPSSSHMPPRASPPAHSLDGGHPFGPASPSTEFDPSFGFPPHGIPPLSYYPSDPMHPHPGAHGYPGAYPPYQYGDPHDLTAYAINSGFGMAPAPAAYGMDPSAYPARGPYNQPQQPAAYHSNSLPPAPSFRPSFPASGPQPIIGSHHSHPRPADDELDAGGTPASSPPSQFMAPLSPATSSDSPFDKHAVVSRSHAHMNHLANPPSAYQNAGYGGSSHGPAPSQVAPAPARPPFSSAYPSAAPQSSAGPDGRVFSRESITSQPRSPPSPASGSTTSDRSAALSPGPLGPLAPPSDPSARGSSNAKGQQTPVRREQHA